MGISRRPKFTKIPSEPIFDNVCGRYWRFLASELLKLIIFLYQQKKCASSFSTETTLENNKFFEDIVFFLKQTKLLRVSLKIGIAVLQIESIETTLTVS